MNIKKSNFFQILETITPTIAKSIIKRLYLKIIRFYNRIKYIERGKFVEFGYRFRYSRSNPYGVKIDERSIVEDFNIWNAKDGEIKIGKRCWIGLHNIIMGPVVMGDNVSTGPYVKILGPRHAFHGYNYDENKKTIIGNNVWLSTDSIILFGVSIGDNAVVTPGSIVTKNVPENSVFSGNPARDITKMVNVAWRKDLK